MRPGRSSDEVATTVDRLATLLEAGVAPESAWQYVGEFTHNATVSAIARTIAAGVRPVDALTRILGARSERVTTAMAMPMPRGSPSRRRRSAPTSPGMADESMLPWRTVGAAWFVADAAGASLAPSLRQLAATARDRAETEREIALGLAGPLATARLVGWLPLLGLALGVLMGVDVIGALLGGPIGWGLLIAGGSLALAGRFWTRALRRRALPTGEAPGCDLDLVAVALSGGVSVARAIALVREGFARYEVPAGDSSGLNDTLALAERAGAPAVDLLRSSAQQARRDARVDGMQVAAALGVRLMLPLGVCVLPSFMLIGVAPMVLSIVSSTVGAM